MSEKKNVLLNSRAYLDTAVSILEKDMLGESWVKYMLEDRASFEFGRLAFEKASVELKEVETEMAIERYRHTVVILSVDEAKELYNHIADLESRLESITKNLERGFFD